MSNSDKLLVALESAAKKNPYCGKMFCTTCGGYGYHIFRNLDSDIKELIAETLATSTVEEFTALKGWRYKIMRDNEAAVLRLFSRGADQLDIKNVRQVDEFLFNSRIALLINPPQVVMNDSFGEANNLQVTKKHFLDSFAKVLQIATALAIDTEDRSLIETIALVARDIVLENDSLKRLLLELAREDQQLARVAYNKFREELPEVRRFVGDGTT